LKYTTLVALLTRKNTFMTHRIKHKNKGACRAFNVCAVCWVGTTDSVLVTIGTLFYMSLSFLLTTFFCTALQTPGWNTNVSELLRCIQCIVAYVIVYHHDFNTSRTVMSYINFKLFTHSSLIFILWILQSRGNDTQVINSIQFVSFF
jgi:hypothetical protein